MQKFALRGVKRVEEKSHLRNTNNLIILQYPFSLLKCMMAVCCVLLCADAVCMNVYYLHFPRVRALSKNQGKKKTQKTGVFFTFCRVVKRET